MNEFQSKENLSKIDVSRKAWVFILLVLLVTSGCVSTTREVTPRKVTFEPRESSEVKIVTRDEIKDRHYFSLGEIEFDFKPERISDGSLDWIYEKMKPLASAEGAQAVYNIRIDSLDSKKRRLRKFIARGTAIGFLDIYPQGTWPDRDYIILGRVYSSIQGIPMNPGTAEKVMEEIRPLAVNLGADAIMDLYISNQGEFGKTPNGRWGSALAIKYIRPGEQKPHLERPEFIVGIRPWGHLEKNAREVRVYLGILLSSAQYYLERKRFHASIAEVPISYRDLDSLDILRRENAPASEEDELLFGRDTRYILLIDRRYMNKSRKAVSLTGSRYIRATLISKLTGEIIWENTISVDFDLMERLYDGGNFRADYNRATSGVYTAAGSLFVALPSEKGLADRDNKREKSGAIHLTDREKELQKGFSELLEDAEQHLLYDAVVKDSMSIIEKMLVRGVDINTRGYNGNTLLHAAVANGHETLVKYLLARGAGADYKNGEGLTPLELAEKLNEPDYDLSTIIDLLENYSVADRNSR